MQQSYLAQFVLLYSQKFSWIKAIASGNGKLAITVPT